MKMTNITAGDLANPHSKAWGSVSGETVSLGPIPVSAQPTAYIREAWANRAYASTSSAKVAAASDGDRLYVRIEWADDAKANAEFQDAAAAVFPGAANSAGETMGSAAAPMGMWYWQHGRGEVLNLTSYGRPGSSERTARAPSAAAPSQQMAGGRWC